MSELSEYDWVIAISALPNKGGVRMWRVTGSVKYVKSILMMLVENDRKANLDKYESGTEKEECIGETIGYDEAVELNAYSIFSDVYITYTAARVDVMPEC